MAGVGVSCTLIAVSSGYEWSQLAELWPCMSGTGQRHCPWLSLSQCHKRSCGPARFGPRTALSGLEPSGAQEESVAGGSP